MPGIDHKNSPSVVDKVVIAGVGSYICVSSRSNRIADELAARTAAKSYSPDFFQPGRPFRTAHDRRTVDLLDTGDEPVDRHRRRIFPYYAKTGISASRLRRKHAH